MDEVQSLLWIWYILKNCYTIFGTQKIALRFFRVSEHAQEPPISHATSL